MKIWVKLKDTGSMLHDTTSGQTITGKAAVEVEHSARIEKAIRGGALIKLTDTEAKALNKDIKPADLPNAQVNDAAPVETAAEKKAREKKEADEAAAAAALLEEEEGKGKKK